MLAGQLQNPGQEDVNTQKEMFLLKLYSASSPQNVLCIVFEREYCQKPFFFPQGVGCINQSYKLEDLDGNKLG